MQLVSPLCLIVDAMIASSHTAAQNIAALAIRTHNGHNLKRPRGVIAHQKTQKTNTADTNEVTAVVESEELDV